MKSSWLPRSGKGHQDTPLVLIQHLDPNHESMVPDLLSRHTGLRVLQVTKKTRIEKNTVNIIPPGKYLGLEGYRLVLSEPPESRGMRMAIDYFFKALAENMPGMNGIQATREILKAHPHVRIIGLSINAEEEVPESLFAAGAKAYLSKDGLSSELIEQIRKKE